MFAEGIRHIFCGKQRNEQKDELLMCSIVPLSILNFHYLRFSSFLIAILTTYNRRAYTQFLQENESLPYWINRGEVIHHAILWYTTQMKQLKKTK